MTVELRPSNNYPGRTDLLHKTHAGSNLSTQMALTTEDLAELRDLLNAGATEATRWKHTDEDGDTLAVDMGYFGAVVSMRAEDGNQVALRNADLPGLITMLQKIEAETRGN